MSVKVSSWVWHGEECAELAGNEMILLLALADVADDNGRCRFVTDDDDLSYAGLARKARVSRSTVIRLMAKFRDADLVEQVKGVKGRSNEFRIVVPWAPKSGSNVEPNQIPARQDSVSSETDSVPSETLFGSTADVGTSLIRKDVVDVVNAHDSFSGFWSVWPRKDAKKTAESAWARAVKRAQPAEIIAAATAYAQSPFRPEKQFVPYAATWLNGDRWTDPLPEARGGSAQSPDERFREGIERGARLQALADANGMGA